MILGKTFMPLKTLIMKLIKSKVTNCEELQQLVKKISGLKYENF